MFMCGSGSCALVLHSSEIFHQGSHTRLQACYKHLYLLSQLTGPGFSFLSLPLIPLEREEFPVRNVSVRRPLSDHRDGQASDT